MAMIWGDLGAAARGSAALFVCAFMRLRPVPRTPIVQKGGDGMGAPPFRAGLLNGVGGRGCIGLAWRVKGLAGGVGWVGS